MARSPGCGRLSGQRGVRARLMPATDPVALRSERAMAFFNVAFTHSFAGHFSALRVPHWGLPHYPADRPLVVLANHPSWWDGAMFMLLLRRFFIERQAFMPMDADALRKYGFMRRLGVFGIERDSPRGAVRFLDTARHVLANPRHMLWMNAPGRFADVRERPVPLAPGVMRLPEIAPTALFIPLAFEYTHWTEKRGEALAAFGPALDGQVLLALDRPRRAEALRDALAATMDRLAVDAISRDPDRFLTAIEGGRGMGGLYGTWQYVKALARGQRPQPDHAAKTPRG